MSTLHVLCGRLVSPECFRMSIPGICGVGNTLKVNWSLQKTKVSIGCHLSSVPFGVFMDRC